MCAARCTLEQAAGSRVAVTLSMNRDTTVHASALLRGAWPFCLVHPCASGSPAVTHLATQSSTIDVAMNNDIVAREDTCTQGGAVPWRGGGI